jgi:hypothetical protein
MYVSTQLCWYAVHTVQRSCCAVQRPYTRAAYSVYCTSVHSERTVYTVFHNSSYTVMHCNVKWYCIPLLAT